MKAQNTQGGAAPWSHVKKLACSFLGLIALLLAACAFAPCAYAREAGASDSASVAGAIADLRAAGDSSAQVTIASGFDSADDLDPYFEGLTAEERLYASAYVEVDTAGEAHYSVVAHASQQWSTSEELASEAAAVGSASFDDTIMAAWDNLYNVVYVGNCNINKDNLKYRYMSVFYADVDMFNVLRSWYYWWDDDGTTTEIRPIYYTSDVATYRSMQAEYEAAVSEAIDTVPCGATDTEKVYILHNYLCNKTTYAWDEYYEDEGSSGTSIAYPLIFTGYGALVDAKGIESGARCVCEGYSKTLCDLLGRVGVKAINLAVFEISHAWSMVKVDGSWYHVDATWDDYDGYDTGCYYSYFLKTDDEISLSDHRGWQNGDTGNNKTTSYGWSGEKATSTTYSQTAWSSFTVNTAGKHTWNSGATTIAATCTASGLKTYTCAVCGATKTEKIAAKGGSHTWGSWQTVRKMVCGEDGNAGIRKHTCTRCGASEQEEVEQAAWHTWDSGKVTKEPTTKETGIKTYTCTVCGTTKTESIDKLVGIEMYRLYNRWSGEHLYTSDASEKNNLVSLGWNYEGIGWTAPTSGTPVYRLYNSYAPGGEHHYTMDTKEVSTLVKAGWTNEGVKFYSASTSGVPVYREYNHYAFSNNHNYTADKSEHDKLIKLGWNDEKIGWYGVK